ncbi:MAG TPA: polysaccharide biosynthesis/export family protein [Chthoniobacteraceae bacterium]|nr:polysaccharide biosynthesis/export family protein [Chthoniobacteraceae bacterium]
MKNLRPLSILALAVAFLPCALRAQTSGAFQVGDVLELHVTGVPSGDSSQFGSYVVDDHGMVSLPFSIQVKVAGMQPGQIQQAIESRYIEAGIYKHPVVDARKIRGKDVKFVTVIIKGGVKEPQRVLYTGDLTLITAINASGGWSDLPSNRIRLQRGRVVLIYNMLDIEHGKVIDPLVLPGDEITVGVPKPAEEH